MHTQRSRSTGVWGSDILVTKRWRCALHFSVEWTIEEFYFRAFHLTIQSNIFRVRGNWRIVPRYDIVRRDGTINQYEFQRSVGSTSYRKERLEEFSKSDKLSDSREFTGFHMNVSNEQYFDINHDVDNGRLHNITVCRGYPLLRKHDCWHN